MKTPIQRAIDLIKAEQLAHAKLTETYTPYQRAINILLTLLPAEREAIERAYEEGFGHPDADFYKPEVLADLKESYFETNYLL